VDKVALLAVLKAKAGKENEVEQFLKSAEPLAAQEPGTSAWYAFKIGEGHFGIYDTFKDEAGREAHLSGQIAKTLFARAEELFERPPFVEKLEILASTTSAA
jgi:quinol monooxygenase YgiN